MPALEICVNARRRLCHRVQDHAGFVEPEHAVTQREHDFRAFAGELTFDNLAAAVGKDPLFTDISMELTLKSRMGTCSQSWLPMFLHLMKLLSSAAKLCPDLRGGRSKFLILSYGSCMQTYWAYLARKQCYVREIDLCVEPISLWSVPGKRKSFFLLIRGSLFLSFWE